MPCSISILVTQKSLAMVHRFCLPHIVHGDVLRPCFCTINMYIEICVSLCVQDHIRRESTVMGACSGLAHVRQAEAGATGPVRGAGEGLWGMLLQTFFAGHLQPAHVNTKDKQNLMGEQVRIIQQSPSECSP